MKSLVKKNQTKHNGYKESEKSPCKFFIAFVFMVYPYAKEDESSNQEKDYFT